MPGPASPCGPLLCGGLGVQYTNSMMPSGTAWAFSAFMNVDPDWVSSRGTPPGDSGAEASLVERKHHLGPFLRVTWVCVVEHRLHGDSICRATRDFNFETFFFFETVFYSYDKTNTFVCTSFADNKSTYTS